MTPSERIKYIKEICRRLSPEDWGEIDLVLKQFGLPTTEHWEGGKSEYIIYMVEGGNDDTLVALAEHVGFTETFVQIAEPQFWLPGHFRLFISHIAKFKKMASALQQALAEYGISGFVAHEDIEPTKEWQDEIELALNTMDAMTAMLHAGFKDSNWTDQEVGVAIGRGLVVVPLRLEVDPYGFIAKFQAIRGKEKTTAQIADELCRVLLANPKTRARMAAAVVTKFATSASFAEAKRNMTLVESCGTLTDAMKEQLKHAIENNSQVREAFGVRDRVRQLLK